MQQTNAPGDTESVHVRTSSVAPLNLELNTETDITGQNDSKNTNSLTDLARVADRDQSSGCNRRTRLMILSRVL
eukprot:7972689-Pyramimonas_sp.AAC.1